LKDLHRRIVLSSVYRTRSKPVGGSDPDANWQNVIEADPANELLARFPRRRLDAESIRDAMLSASESLNHEAGGPGVSPPLPQELIQTLKSGQWKTSPREADHYRRSIYIFARRNLRYPLFATFDRPAANCSCAVRHRSTTAIQSLLLLNSKITLDAAQRLAREVAGTHATQSSSHATQSSSHATQSSSHATQSSSHATQSSQCTAIYRRVLSRDPVASEQRECIEFLKRQTSILVEEGRADPEIAALTDLGRAIFNSNQFLYVD
jgi:hypothetical protein